LRDCPYLRISYLRRGIGAKRRQHMQTGVGSAVDIKPPSAYACCEHMFSHRILHVDLDAFFVSVERRDRPELVGVPVVVGGRPDSRGVVSCASYEARKYGLHAGMPLSRAQRLCPQAIFLEGDYHRYGEASNAFQAILADFSPDLEVVSIDEAYLDITGSEYLFGPPKELGRKLKARVRSELGLPASVGIASCKVVAKVASDRAKPDGLVEVPAGQEAAFLSPLPVGDLPFAGRTTEATLRRLGITTIGQLAAVPPEHLRAIFGVHGIGLHRFANGIDERPVAPPGPRKSISHSTTFAHDTFDPVFLKAMLLHLTERVGHQLREQERMAREIVLRVRYSDFETISRHRRLASPTDADQDIYQVGSSLLDRVLHVARKPVRLLGIAVGGLVEDGYQLPLFPLGTRDWRGLNQAVDRLRDRYGFDCLHEGRTLALSGMPGLRDEE